MTGLEIWLLAIGLAMDCFAVSIASGIILKRTQWRPMLVMAFAFGFFQALMPFIGWMFAKSFSHLIESVDHCNSLLADCVWLISKWLPESGTLAKGNFSLFSYAFLYFDEKLFLFIERINVQPIFLVR